MKKNELSSLIETAAGYAILYAEDVKEPAVPEISTVYEQVKTDYLTEQANKAAEETAIKLLQNAKENGSLSKSAEDEGLTVSHSGDIPRGGGDTTIPAAVVSTAFSLSAGSPFNEDPVKDGSFYYIIQFKELKAPQATLSDEDKTRYENAIIRRKQQQILYAWLQDMRNKAKILTHENL